MIEADPGRYPEPVRWLPDLARWVCHQTGNFVLDHHFDPYDPLCFNWILWSDIEKIQTIKQDWPKAKRVIPKLDHLMQWYEEDQNNLINLAEFLMEDTDDDPLQYPS